MKRIAYYHVFLTENHSTWMNIVMEQYKEMEDSDLFANIDDFRVTCVGKNIEDFEIFSHLTRMHFPNAARRSLPPMVQPSLQLHHAPGDSTTWTCAHAT